MAAARLAAQSAWGAVKQTGESTYRGARPITPPPSISGHNTQRKTDFSLKRLEVAEEYAPSSATAASD